MTITRTIAVAGIAVAMLCQAQDKQERKEDRPERKEQRQERKEEVHRQPEVRRAPEERRAPAAAEPAQRHTEPSQPRRETLPQTQQSRPAQPEQRQQVNRAPQVAPNDRPARNQPGNQPGNQPAGRSFGTPPGRPVTPPNTRMSAPPRTITTRNGDFIRRDSSGQVRQVRMSNGTVVYHPPNGPRRVEVVRPGNRVVVASGRGYGYVQRPVVVQNTTIIKRTYIYNGTPAVRLYRPHVFNGITLAVYTPVRYYRPVYYTWVVNPWPQPIVYSWGWAGRPWFGYYGGYFTPYPAYPAPAFWLTDYMMAAMLEEAYQERMAAAYNTPPPGQTVAMTPEVKQAISDEVRRQIDRERAESQSGVSGPDTSIFSGSAQQEVFVVNAPYTLTTNSGECTVAEGDVLQMTDPPAAGARAANVVVLSSRPPSCRQGVLASAWLEDLQEMHNQMMATLDRGMSELQSKQGQGGLPSLPSGAAGTIDSPYAQAAQPDSNASAELNEVTQQADRDEQQALSEPTSAAVTPTLTMGLSIDDVKAIEGEPQTIVDLGTKKIYMYKNLKITFIDGKVTDIQ